VRKKAFTLIELMIVVAIISIATAGFFVGFPPLFDDLSRYQALIEENRSLTLAYGKIRNCLKKSRQIARVVDGRIIFDNNNEIAIENFGKQIRVNGRIFLLKGRASISEIEQISDTMFMTRVDAGNEKLRILWRTGESNE
jgi:prepilin-type N-terminal cleavage/methylation domain-containing protein